MQFAVCNIFTHKVMKETKSFEESGGLIKDVNETIKKEVKEQNGGFLSMFLGTLGTILLGIMLEG